MRKIYLIVILIIFIILFLLFNNQTSYSKSKPILIAHAGGALNGNIYLNSKEAVKNAILNGFQYIELDLLETLDGDIIAAHDWKHFHKLTNYTINEQPITIQEASKRKILKNQTVLTSNEIYDIFMSHPNIYLVTDKIQNIDLLHKKFSNFKDRIIVEVFSLEKYNEVKQKGFFDSAFCVSNDNLLYKLVEENNINTVTLSAKNISNKIKWYKKHHNVVGFAFSDVKGIVNNKKAILKYSPYIKYWYTDFLTPKMF